MRRTRLTAEAIEAFTPDVKVGLLATLDPRGLPHVSLITSLTAKGEGALMFGQFTEGRSKLHVRQDPRVGFLVLSMDRRMWRGKARWTAATREGEDHLAFNARSMFRYNAYFGVHTVHHLELVAVSERMRVPLPSMLAGGLRARLVRPSLGAGRPEVFNAWTRRHLQGLTTLKFLCFADADGYPRLVPCVPCAPVGPGRLAFAPTAFAGELAGLREGTPVAVFALNLATESVLLRGPFAGFRGLGPLRLGLVDVDWVYNSMPPVPGRIYPPEPLQSAATV